ncbi:T-complex protein 1 subunit theta [Octopus sinensis]|uniref:T-complex protein 1 subunit theta n=1 Tax=Octopus sinensis TaxID=2607531 RepID=A0A6P7TG13_9MOLL|nr:T-complex protein 1 subunit theta [Octopus sinensis]
MALHVPKAPGFSSMLKEGARHYMGLEEAIYRNIDACKEIAKTTRSAYGPHGQNKMIINHIEKLFVTNDAATILNELSVQHPAAKMLVMASQQQEQECGDGTNAVLILAGSFLEHAEELLRMGLSVPEVIEGYEIAYAKATEYLPELVVGQVKDLRNREDVRKVIRSAVMSKQYGSEDFLSDLITDACIGILSMKNTFNVDNVRVCKILGCSMMNSSVLQGMVFKRAVEGDITKAEKCKIAIYSCPLDSLQTETKGTVLIKTAEELLNFSKGEEDQMEKHIQTIADSGVNVIVTGGKVGELSLHYCNKYNLLVVRLLSKFDLRRLARSVSATVLPKITVPTTEEMGFCDHVYVDEIGETAVVIFKQEKDDTAISTIVVRGSSDNIVDDIERCIDDGVNTFKAMTKDSRLVAGAGAVEIELAKRITTFGESIPGLEQYAIKKYAQSLEVLPQSLAENTGAKSREVLSKLYASHQEGKQNVGVNIEDVGGVMDSVEKNILDLYTKFFWILKFATTAACTVLNVDQIIMAKPAGGPKTRETKDWDED